MKKLTLICAALFLANLAQSQDPKLSVELSSDTLLLGNYFELKFTIENAPSSAFEPPALTNFKLVGGPNTSTSMSIVNGDVSQSSSFTYYLEPIEIGSYTIEPAYVTIDENVIETPPIDIVVSPNPEGIIQEPHSASKRFNQLQPDSNASKPGKKPRKPRKKF